VSESFSGYAENVGTGFVDRVIDECEEPSRGCCPKIRLIEAVVEVREEFEMGLDV